MSVFFICRLEMCHRPRHQLMVGDKWWTLWALAQHQLGPPIECIARGLLATRRMRFRNPAMLQELRTLADDESCMSVQHMVCAVLGTSDVAPSPVGNPLLMSPRFQICICPHTPQVCEVNTVVPQRCMTRRLWDPGPGI